MFSFGQLEAATVLRNYLTCRVGESHPLFVLDCHDRDVIPLRKWSRERKSAYTRAGWFAPGIDPIQGRVDAFLASRKEAT